MKIKFSPSAIKSWMGCSLAAKFRYVDGMRSPSGSAAMYGSALHEALDAFHKGATEKASVEVFNRYMEENPPDYWNRNTKLTTYLDQGPKIIAEYIDQRRWSTATILASEKRFMVDFGDHQLSGIIDLIEVPKDHSELSILDLKSGRRPILDQLHLDIQFTSYTWAVQQKEFWCGYPGEEDKYSGFDNGEELYEHFKSIPVKSYWYDLKKNESIFAGDKDTRDYARLYRVMEQIQRAIDLEVFMPKIDEQTCSWCEYRDICPVWFPALDEFDSEVEVG